MVGRDGAGLGRSCSRRFGAALGLLALLGGWQEGQGGGGTAGAGHAHGAGGAHFVLVHQLHDVVVAPVQGHVAGQPVHVICDVAVSIVVQQELTHRVAPLLGCQEQRRLILPHRKHKGIMQRNSIVTPQKTHGDHAKKQYCDTTENTLGSLKETTL